MEYLAILGGVAFVIAGSMIGYGLIRIAKALDKPYNFPAEWKVTHYNAEQKKEE